MSKPNQEWARDYLVGKGYFVAATVDELMDTLDSYIALGEEACIVDLIPDDERYEAACRGEEIPRTEWVGVNTEGDT